MALRGNQSTSPHGPGVKARDAGDKLDITRTHPPMGQQQPSCAHPTAKSPLRPMTHRDTKPVQSGKRKTSYFCPFYTFKVYKWLERIQTTVRKVLPRGQTASSSSSRRSACSEGAVSLQARRPLRGYGGPASFNRDCRQASCLTRLQTASADPCAPPPLNEALPPPSVTVRREHSTWCKSFSTETLTSHEFWPWS